jgi:hypothetical protein
MYVNIFIYMLGCVFVDSFFLLSISNGFLFSCSLHLVGNLDLATVCGTKLELCAVFTLLCCIKCTCRVLYLNILEVYFCKVLAIEQTTKKHFGMLQFKELYSKSLLLKQQVCATRNNIEYRKSQETIRLIVVN